MSPLIDIVEPRVNRVEKRSEYNIIPSIDGLDVRSLIPRGLERN